MDRRELLKMLVLLPLAPLAWLLPKEKPPVDGGEVGKALYLLGDAEVFCPLCDGIGSVVSLVGDPLGEQEDASLGWCRCVCCEGSGRLPVSLS